ncbi:hypothetical protein [Myceligenerans indicum]|uniref:Uncharacterized protein n=1 Tax=Myceligenerans indicum TaxID=2593663 RepID=A0ABS1LJ00_9MICO|nr:hypothetical protein [Myceligenerans indicum]MBL0886215.1 hypothetical protein [Myceligenerans indicum]
MSDDETGRLDARVIPPRRSPTASISGVTQRLRAFDPESDEWHWLEFEDDGEPLRHIVFSGDEPTVAGRTADRLALRDQFGIPGDELYEAVYGAMTYTNLLDAEFPPDPRLPSPPRSSTGSSVAPMIASGAEG